MYPKCEREKYADVQKLDLVSSIAAAQLVALFTSCFDGLNRFFIIKLTHPAPNTSTLYAN